jgi:hypothetical protein
MPQIHPKDIKPAWGAINETRVSTGPEPRRRLLGHMKLSGSSCY